MKEYDENVELKVTSIKELLEAGAGGELVNLPPFVEGKPFVAKLRKPSLLAMVKNGSIPNELLVEANKLFAKGAQGVASDTLNPEMMNNMFALLDIICEEAFVEPKYKAIKDAGIQLTDAQQLAIFDYTQNGVRQLNSFRKIG